MKIILLGIPFTFYLLFVYSSTTQRCVYLCEVEDQNNLKLFLCNIKLVNGNPNTL